MKIKLSEGNGGEEMNALIKRMRAGLGNTGKWANSDNDSATLQFGDKHLHFTTDSYVVSPIFFPGGDIGKIAACGTINDLAVMGAEPLGISLSLVLEEGFDKSGLERILDSISHISKETGIPIVTGDTKVVDKGKLDGIVINSSGIGESRSVLDEKIEPGDNILISGGIGEHAIALLSRRLDFKTDLKTDSKPLVEEIRAIRHRIKQAKDITRGGLASALNELAEKSRIGILLDESQIPVKRQVLSAAELLGLDHYELACEGRFVCACRPEDTQEALETLKEFDPEAEKIGQAMEGNEVILKTRIGKRKLQVPTGNLVPRIC